VFSVQAIVREILPFFADELISFFLVWAAIINDRDYIRMEGINCVVADTKHRKELVAGGLDEYLTAGVRDIFWMGSHR
jgi:hypothetical protein